MNGSGFRPDIEGLRALAVGAVLAYHASLPGLGGGFVGVDMFFVISGFLITGLLVTEIRARGRVDFAHFFARRARRLLPASILVLLFVVVGAAWFSAPIDRPLIAGDVAAAAVYVPNLRFALQSADYLGGDREASPVLHYWSLAVEEQFYLAWPLLLMLTLVWSVRRRDAIDRVLRVRLGWTLALTGLCSFIAALWLTEVAQPWSFFAPWTRAWEFAAGAAVFALQPQLLRLPGAALAALGWAGLGLVVLGLTWIDPLAFPGFSTLLPVAGTAALIASGTSRGEALAAGNPARWLCLPPFRAVGRVSYSLYLWHWPVLVFAAAALGPLEWPQKLAWTLASALPAVLAYRWVEKPIHRGKRPPQTPAAGFGIAVAASASGLLAAAWLGGALSSGTTAPPPATASGTDRAPPLEVQIAEARADLPSIYADGCHAGITVSEPRSDCFRGAATAPGLLVLFGDSKAAQWHPTLEAIAEGGEWRILALTKSGCAAADVTVRIPHLGRAYHECDAWREFAFERIAGLRGRVVVLASSNYPGIIIDRESGDALNAEQAREAWVRGWIASLERLGSDGRQAVLLRSTATADFDPAACVSRQPADADACSIPLTPAAERLLDLERQAAERVAHANLLDPKEFLCSEDRCPALDAGWLVYRDRLHLTARYAARLAPELRERLPPATDAGAGAAGR